MWKKSQFEQQQTYWTEGKNYMVQVNRANLVNKTWVIDKYTQIM